MKSLCVMERRGDRRDLQGWQEQLGGHAQRTITHQRQNEKTSFHLHRCSREVQKVEVWPHGETLSLQPASWLKAEHLSHTVQVRSLWHRCNHSSSVLVCWRHSGNTTSRKATFSLVHCINRLCACGPEQDNWSYYPLRGSFLLHAAHSTFNGESSKSNQ